MYTKISTGKGFSSAALYDAEGLSKEQKAQKAGKVELLLTGNLLSADAQGIADEMQARANYSKTLKPVWNISMSAPNGVELTIDQWQQAALLNLKALGADPERFQYAIYRHKDTKNDHIHILLNAVPVGGGPALSRQFNARKARLAAPGIDQALGLADAGKQATEQKLPGVREVIQSKLWSVLAEKPVSADELATKMAKQGVVVKYSTNVSGIYGLTLRLDSQEHKPVKGSAIVLEGGQTAKWNNLDALLALAAEQARQVAEQARQAAEQAEQAEQAEEKARQAAAENVEKQRQDELKAEKARQEQAAKPVVAAATTPPGVSTPPVVKTLHERVKEQYGIDFYPGSIEKLAMGQEVNSEKKSLTVWLDTSTQKLHSKPYTVQNRPGTAPDTPTFPEKILGAPVSEKQRQDILDGKVVRMEGLTLKNGEISLGDVRIDTQKSVFVITPVTQKQAQEEKSRQEFEKKRADSIQKVNAVAKNESQQAETPSNSTPVKETTSSATTQAATPAWHEDLRKKLKTKKPMALQSDDYQVESLNYGSDYRFRPHASRDKADWVKLSELNMGQKKTQNQGPKMR